jgi:diadenosine tetraphosphate (Ap4A) HIT family hydrolase
MPESMPFQPPVHPVPGCALCEAPGGVPVWQDAQWRVIRAEDADHPAFYRVVCRVHVGEFSDLPLGDRHRCMALVVAVEQVLREQLRPTKINLASLGNVVPHLHWHVIARFEHDSHFPQPVWAPRQRDPDIPAWQRLACSLEALDAQVRAALDRA